MLKIVLSNQFKKDIKLCKSRGLNIDDLKVIVDDLASGKTLPNKYKDHNLLGEFAGFKECHIHPDWLLIYKIESYNCLFLFRTGTHSDLFK